LHRDNHEIPVSEFVDALDEIKKDGLIHKIGASNWEQHRFEEARSFAITHNKEPFQRLKPRSNSSSMPCLVPMDSTPSETLKQ
jgi:aryl-alcohol dehydrogenase-like predicted oxidoreductase